MGLCTLLLNETDDRQTVIRKQYQHLPEKFLKEGRPAPHSSFFLPLLLVPPLLIPFILFLLPSLLSSSSLFSSFSLLLCSERKSQHSQSSFSSQPSSPLLFLPTSSLQSITSKDIFQSFLLCWFDVNNPFVRELLRHKIKHFSNPDIIFCTCFKIMTLIPFKMR